MTVADPNFIADYAHLASPISLGSRIIPNFTHRTHQKVISDALMDAVAGRGSRFICLSIPMQFGKSELTSFLLPLLWQEWHALGLVPGGLVGLVSYEDSLPMAFSNRIRRTIEANQDTFLTRLRRDSKAASFWETEAGGGLLALGIGGTIVGRSISLFVLDDVLKNAEMASSERQRESQWDWWSSVAIGRLQPWTIVLVVGVRFREDDFIGRLTSPEYNGRSHEWRYIRIPAVADSENDPCGREIGDALLRPQVNQTQEEANNEMSFVKDSISAYSWATYWMQNPTDPEGTIFFEKDWVYWAGDSGNALPSPKEFDLVLMSWDLAFKEEKQNDWVVGQAWGRKGADYYLIDQVRGHWGFTETVARIKSFASRIRNTYPRATTILVEDKANGPAVINQLQRQISGLIPVTPDGSKESRYHACQPFLIAGNLHIPAPSVYPWVKEFVREMSDAPRGAHDDVCDCCVQALLWAVDRKSTPVSIITGEDEDLSFSPIHSRR